MSADPQETGPQGTRCAAARYWSQRAGARRHPGATSLVICIAVMLAACSSSGPRPPPSTVRVDPAGSRPPAAPGRSGAYYLDDGPGAGAPADLDAIPDAVPRAEPLLARANRPYTLFDRQYEPMTRLAPFRERGPGSWYGRKYHGQRTSSGEVYDMYAMTAAHPTLPIPSYARVTHTGNGRSVVVRVNDRGPFLYGRIIDLSYTAAAKLGYVNAGSGPVEVELITQFDAPGSAAPAGVAVATSATAATAATAASGGPVASSVSPAAAAAQPERLDVETVIAPAPAVAVPLIAWARPPWPPNDPPPISALPPEPPLLPPPPC